MLIFNDITVIIFLKASTDTSDMVSTTEFVPISFQTELNSWSNADLETSSITSTVYDEVTTNILRTIDTTPTKQKEEKKWRSLFSFSYNNDL